MIVVTGALGFIGSCLISKLNDLGFNNIIAVDDFSAKYKEENLKGKKIKERVERESFHSWLDENNELTEFIFHFGAKTDTAEFNLELLARLNTEYTKTIWNKSIAYQIPFIYASSAATYGLGENGYEDDESKISLLKPLNPYGESKNEFDKWAINQKKQPFFWVGLKFFNVYGPNEYHKGRMASVIFHAFNQINNTNKMRLFKSHNEKYKDGEQMRDFIYVKDIMDLSIWLMHHRNDSGIYNLGSGEARTFNDLVKNVFQSLNKEEKIEYIDTPIDIRDKYQYFTQASMGKLQSIGYNKEFTTLEEGVKDYVKNYLMKNAYI